MNTQIIELGRKFKEVKERHDEAANTVKAISAEWAEIETQLLDAMVEEGCRSINIEGVGMLSMRVTNFLSVNAANKERFFEYLKDTGNDGILKLDVNPKTLTAWLKEHLDNLKTGIMEAEGLDEVMARQKALDQLNAEGASYFTKRDIALKATK